MAKEFEPRKAEVVETRWHRRLSPEELLQMALRDPLTGLLNRRAFEEELREIWGRARTQGSPIGLLMMDIDHFKAMNDTYGHVVGDQILKECARRVRSCVRENDVVCRYYGGDELVAILPTATEADTRQAAERLLAAFRNTVLCPGVYDIQATISIGANCIQAANNHTLEQLLIQADRALYRAKQTGRNKACFAGEAPPPEATAPLQAGPPGDLKPVRTILMVDDEQSLCQLFRRMLARHDFEVLAAGTGAEAVEIARRERGMIDVALVDLHLGEENGLEVLKKLQAIDEGITGIIITGAATLDDAVAALRQGAYDFVQKPVTAEQLTAAVERAIKCCRLMAETKRYRQHLEDMVRE